MSGSQADFWQGPSGTLPVVNANGNIFEEVQVATAAQTVFTLLSFTYTVGQKSIWVFRKTASDAGVGGEMLRRAVDYTETSSSVITLAVGATVGDILTFVAFGVNQLIAPVVNNGLPQGGATGQFLKKSSGSDYVTTWADLPNFSVLLDAPRVNIAAASTVNLAAIASTTRNIQITGSTQIDGFQIASGQLWVVRFAASLLLKNNGGIITQTGRDIRVPAGSTCLLRAVADNIVEVVSFTNGPRVRWTIEDGAALGDGVTDDRDAIQTVLNDFSTYGGGVIYAVPGKTYLIRHKTGATKLFGSFSHAYGLEIPDNVRIDLQGATFKAEAATDYVLLSNVTTTPGLANNSNLGISNGTIDYNLSNSAGTAQSAAFFGVRKLYADKLTIINGYNVAFDMENCDQHLIGDLTFVNCFGAGFYLGGASAGGGGECLQGKIGTITTFNQADHPTNPGLPGNPMLLNISSTQIDGLVAYNCAAGIKITDGADIQIGKVFYDTSTTQNSGFKIQGSSETQTIDRVTVGEVIVKNTQGSGLLINWTRGVEIGNYIGKGNATLGLDADASIAGDNIKIGNFESIDAGQAGLILTTSNGLFTARSPEVVINNLKIKNPWTVATLATATAINITNGSLKIGLCAILDDRATPKLVRWFGSGSNNAEQSLVVDECFCRGPNSNPGFILTGFLNGFIGRPDIAPYDFSGGSLTLTSAAAGAGVTATASSAIFTSAAVDVGKLIISQDGRGVSEITGFTSTTVVTVANRVAWTGTAIASGSWMLDRGSGGRGTFTPAAAATSATIIDYGFINTTSRGFPMIECQPTNASARTLGKPTSYTFGNNTLTFNFAGAAAGTETYQYKIIGWTN